MCRSYMVISNGKEILEVDGTSIVIAKGAKIQQVNCEKKPKKSLHETSQQYDAKANYSFNVFMNQNTIF